MRRARRSQILVAAVVFVVVWGLTTHGKYSSTGDEPHYLIVAESLITDHDLDLANNYAQGDGRLFGNAGLVNDGHARPNVSGKLESVHDIGLPVALVGPYMLAKRISSVVPDDVVRRFRMTHGLLTYSLLSLVMAGISALACGLLIPTAAAISFDLRISTLTVLLVALSPPVLSHEFLIFPEIPAFAATCAVLFMAYRGTDGRTYGDLVLVILAIGLLPWFHRKYSLFAIGLLLIIILKRGNDLRALSKTRAAILGACFVLPVALLYTWTWREWGNLGGPQMIESTRLSLSSFPTGAIGLWADREYGVLSLAPIYLLLPAALVLSGRLAWPLLIPVALLYIPMASFTEWWGGFSPAARYVVPCMPIAAVLMTIGASRSRSFRRLFVGLGLLQLVIDGVVWQHPRWLWPHNSGTNEVLQHLGPLGELYQRMLPSVRMEPGTLLLIRHLFWGVVLICAVTWVALQDRQPSAARDPLLHEVS